MRTVDSAAEAPAVIPANAAGARARRWSRRPQQWAGYAAGTWSIGYGALVLGLVAALGTAGFPFGEGDPGAELSVLEGVRAQTGAPVIAGLGLVGAAVAIAMAKARGRGAVRVALLTFAWVTVAVLTLVLPDYRVLMGVAYAPLFLVGAPFGWPGGNFFDVFTWPLVNQLVCIAGGLLWAGAAVAYARRTRGACGNCGRSASRTAGWTRPETAWRWGRWGVYVAVAVPVFYAVTRWAWALGLPLGINEELLRENLSTGHMWNGAGLATLAVGGAILTLGLIQRWGEVFPRWTLVLAGRRVPPALAIVPASLVAVLVTGAGLMFVRLALNGTFGTAFAFLDGQGWAPLVPELLWPVWGVGLGAATLAYHHRRRGPCTHCGRSG